MKNTLDFIKIDGGKLKAINFNNMIQVTKENYRKLEISKQDKGSSQRAKYFHMLYMQLMWLNKNSSKVRNKAKNLYNGYKNKTLYLSVYARCCNFPLLEEKCQKYQENHKIKEYL